MKIAVNSKVATAAQDALAQHAGHLYANLGSRIVVIAELCATERNEIAPDEDKEAGVKLQIKHLEVAGEEQEEAVRQAMRALYTQRTAFGKLTEDQEVELSEATIRRCAGELNAIEAARLHVVVQNWSSYAQRSLLTENLTVTELRHELKAVADGLFAAISAGADPVAA